VIILASLVITLAGSGRLQRVTGWAAIGASVLNSYWWVVDEDRVDLRIGYYLWWLSFVVLGLGLIRMARSRQRRLDLPGGRTRG
jgi:hypothetical protein